MKITLNPELEQLINAQLAMGDYSNVDDLLKDALLTLAEKRKRQALSKNVSYLFDKTKFLANVKDITEEEITAEIETYQQIDELAGTWTEADEFEFLENTKPFREIEKNLWK